MQNHWVGEPAFPWTLVKPRESLWDWFVCWNCLTTFDQNNQGRKDHRWSRDSRTCFCGYPSMTFLSRVGCSAKTDWRKKTHHSVPTEIELIFKEWLPWDRTAIPHCGGMEGQWSWEVNVRRYGVSFPDPILLQKIRKMPYRHHSARAHGERLWPCLVRVGHQRRKNVRGHVLLIRYTTLKYFIFSLVTWIKPNHTTNFSLRILQILTSNVSITDPITQLTLLSCKQFYLWNQQIVKMVHNVKLPDQLKPHDQPHDQPYSQWFLLNKTNNTTNNSLFFVPTTRSTF